MPAFGTLADSKLGVQAMSWLSAAWEWYATEVPTSGGPTYLHASLINPVVASIGAALIIAAALQQASTAQQRHREQTNADRQRRIIESFSKATEQLGSDKMVVRLGGIYTLERVSRESPTDYWTVMETLCAFVRERTSSDKLEDETSETGASVVKSNENPIKWPATDVGAALAVIVRRDETSQERETAMRWRLDFSNANLTRADLKSANLSRANFIGANLSRSNLRGADLTGADLVEANLTGANLILARLSGADLTNANLIKAELFRADLGSATLRGADLSGADVEQANLKGANPHEAKGDEDTVLPDGIERPDHWLPKNPSAAQNPETKNDH